MSRFARLECLKKSNKEMVLSASGGSIEESKQRLLHEFTLEPQGENADLQLSYKRLKTFAILMSCIAVILCALSITTWLNSGQTHLSGLQSARTEISIPSAPVTFELDHRFAGPSSSENDQAWNALMPQGGGFIHLTEEEAQNLPPGKDAGGGGFVYDVSLFHQLHCLASIRAHLLLLQSSISSNNSEKIQQYLLNPQVGHVYHCFDYVRQSLMCGGDMTLEWPRQEKDGSRFAFDGWGIAHQCKDWSAILDYMQEHNVVDANEVESQSPAR